MRGVVETITSETQYDRLGITIISGQTEKGDCAEVIDAGGGKFYGFPMSSISAIQLAADCEYYAECADYPLAPEDIYLLAECFQSDDGERLRGEFYLKRRSVDD